MNKICKGIITTVIAFFSTSLGSNSEEITGAFGIELGQILDPNDPNSNLEPTSTQHNFFNPVNPINSISIYSVVLSPITHKVIAIYGMGNKMAKNKCEDDKNVLVSLLTTKYGEPMEPSYSEQMKGIVGYIEDTSLITVQCDGFMEARLSIVYADHVLSDLAEKERIEIETKKTNADGL